MPDTPVRPLTIGVDLGTSAVKVVALGLDGEVLGEASASFGTDSTLPLQAEQHTSDWLRAASGAMHTLARDSGEKLGHLWTKGVVAVGLTGQLPTLVCLEGDKPIGPAITWKDGRADAWASSRLDTGRRALMYARTGMPIDGRYLAPMLRYHFPDRVASMGSVLSAKDYLLWELTGLKLTEPSTAAGYGVYDLEDRRFSAGLAEFWQVPMSILPQIRPANVLAGPLTEDGASLLGLRTGTPVSTGAADSVCASFAMAGLDERTVSISFGSSTVVVGATSEPRRDTAARYLVTPHVNDAWYGREMDLLATGTGYRWLSHLFSWPDGELDRRAAQSAAGARGLTFPPYLAGGEQGALWNPRLKGAIFGLALRHSRDDIARAFLEGVFFEVRRCIEVLAETAPVETIMVSGNLVSSPSSMQMLADILHRPVGGISERSPAAIGAAIMARRATGIEPDLAPRARANALRPDEASARAYSDIYRRYVGLAGLCE
jgi:xylulokinase